MIPLGVILCGTSNSTNFELLLKYQFTGSKKVLVYSTKHHDRNLKKPKAKKSPIDFLFSCMG